MENNKFGVIQTSNVNAANIHPRRESSGSHSRNWGGGGGGSVKCSAINHPLHRSDLPSGRRTCLAAVGLFSPLVQRLLDRNIPRFKFSSRLDSAKNFSQTLTPFLILHRIPEYNRPSFKDDGPLEPNSTPSCCEGQRGIRRKSRLQIRDEKREEVPRGLDTLVVSSWSAGPARHDEERGQHSFISLSLSFLSGSHDLSTPANERKREREVSR